MEKNIFFQPFQNWKIRLFINLKFPQIIMSESTNYKNIYKNKKMEIIIIKKY